MKAVSFEGPKVCLYKIIQCFEWVTTTQYKLIDHHPEFDR